MKNGVEKPQTKLPRKLNGNAERDRDILIPTSAAIALGKGFTVYYLVFSDLKQEVPCLCTQHTAYL